MDLCIRPTYATVRGLWNAAAQPLKRVPPTSLTLPTLALAWVLALQTPALYADDVTGPADALRNALADDRLRALATEVLERNPEIARARQRAAAAAVKAPQVKALPDPEAMLTFFALPPETRSGPQRLTATLTQRFPWFGKLALREQAAILQASVAQAEVESQKLGLLARVRQQYYELSFLHHHASIVDGEREHLVRHEEVARVRYSAGMGLQQAVLKIQADITRAETRLLEIATRQLAVLAALNGLRDRPANHEILVGPLPRPVSTPGRRKSFANAPTGCSPTWRQHAPRSLTARSWWSSRAKTSIPISK